MRLIRILQKCTIALATIGIALPPGAVLGAEQTAPATSPRVADIALGEGGTLRGQIVDAQGIGQADRPVSVQQQGKKIAEFKTDKEGRFAVSGLRGGIYLVATDGAAGPVRAWAPETAPPSAANGVLLVPQGQTVRGALIDNPRGVLRNPGVWITAAVAGTILAVAVDQNSGS